MDRSEWQYSIRSSLALLTGSAVLFAAGRAFGAFAIASVLGLFVLSIVAVPIFLFLRPVLFKIGFVLSIEPCIAIGDSGCDGLSYGA